MKEKYMLDRRAFLRQAAGTLGAAAQTGNWPAPISLQREHADQPAEAISRDESYPRTFSGRALKMISFPLGGVTAGSIGLGGRGQLRDWEIFNRPNKGYRPTYAFPSIWVQSSGKQPIARVLESRILAPYEGQDGLGSDNVPGLSRLESATFTGEYPLAHIDFEDSLLPVTVRLDAFSPFIPHDADDSGLPVAILRYRVTNPGHALVKVGIAMSLDNPVKSGDKSDNRRVNEYRSQEGAQGFLMSNPALTSDDPMAGTFALMTGADAGASVSHWDGWPQGRWWNSPLLFWDHFSEFGSFSGAEPEPHNAVAALCIQREIQGGATGDFQFLLGWHFPNRTPDWCGWEAAPGTGKTVIGNYYATRFADAWQAASYAAKNLPELEARTLMFAKSFRESTLPGCVKDAASANLSTLATTTCFRTADGEFHGFEGSDDHRGCCFGNCTHVWNYETVTPYLFPAFAKSLRKAAFEYSMDDAGAIHFRELLPRGKERWGFAAADGQMGQIVHAWMDWKISGDDDWLRELWPYIRKALEFAWIPGGWDANRDGVFEGVQHNTYDVEFYGPNPMCGIYYLGALRAAYEMAVAVGENSAGETYRRLFENGQRWIDTNLFNGEYYIQKVRGYPKSQIAENLRSDMGAEDTENPEYQVGAGCLVDQLVGQYLADAGNLGPLVSPEHIRTTLNSIYTYNNKRTLATHDNVARTYALNEEAAVVVCDYAKAERPRIPFPYYPESWTGLEYTAAALMMSWGMVEQGIEVVSNARLRYDGEKRNPWDEAECGHHYARAMAAWSTVIALSGFHYDGARASVIAKPPAMREAFRCFWATGTAWGTFSLAASTKRTRLAITVLAGTLRCRSFEFAAAGSSASVARGGNTLPSSLTVHDDNAIVVLADALSLEPGGELSIEVHG